jgi:DNA-binding NtrC family response regulator
MTAPAKVLIVEDDVALATALAVTVRKAGGVPQTVATAARAAAALEMGDVGLLILDLGLPDRNGLTLLRDLAAAGRSCPPVLILTAHGGLENVIEARKLGVIDFFEKPLDLSTFQPILAQALEAIHEAPRSDEIVPTTSIYTGSAEAMRPVIQSIAQACASQAPVLIEGETGTGKTHTAQLILRQTQPSQMVWRIVAGDSDTVRARLEALLHGEAPISAVLIEEISRLDPAILERLAAWLEERGNGIRLLATSTEPLWPLVQSGTVPAPLYYRLQPGRIALPSLRDRTRDLPTLVAWFLGEIRPGVSYRLKPAALRLLEEHSWPGNLRELRNALEWACQSSGARLGIDALDLPPEIQGRVPATDPLPEPLSIPLRQWLDQRLHEAPDLDYQTLLNEIEGLLLRDLLRRHQNKPSRLAAERDLNRSTLRKRLRELGIDSQER